jgi:1-acyl-sn-glycerol-3-phosphate acyltransferase
VHALTAFLIVGTIFPRASQSMRARILRWWSRKLLRILRIVIDVHGHPPDWQARDLVIVANHISWLDIFVINAIRPTRFVAKSEIRDWPFVGWLCEKTGTIFIKRAKRSDTHKINQVMHDVLTSGDCVGLFPEGTTTGGDRLRKFHSSLFEPAVISGATVMPAAISYREESGERCAAPAYIEDVTFHQSITAIMACPKIIVEVTCADPLSTAAMSRRELATACETMIARILDVEVSRERLTLGGGLTAQTEQFDGP